MVVPIVWRFGQEGPQHWIREDVNQDGVIDIFDLLEVIDSEGW